MTSYFLARQLSLDRVSVALTLTGCLAVLADANREGRAPLQRSIPASDGKLLGKTLSHQQCQHLTQNGYLVVDNFLNQQQVQEARQAIQSLDDQYLFRGGPNEKDDIPSQSRTRDLRGKYYYFIIFMVNCEPSFGKMNLFHIMSDP